MRLDKVQLETRKKEYGEQLARLTAYPEQIFDSWNDGEGFFKHRYWPVNEDYGLAGPNCISQFKYHHNGPIFKIEPDSLQEQIINDDKIPFFKPTGDAAHTRQVLTVDTLQSFKDYAEKLDAAGIV